VVNETDDKEKLEQFINFCEDTIFEVRLLINYIEYLPGKVPFGIIGFVLISKTARNIEG
jgi:hypothetical protein